MRVWGYVLIVLNLVAAGAFLYFASGVRHKRHEWQAAVLKQEIINRGLPVDASEPSNEFGDESVIFPFKTGIHPVTHISKKLLKDLIPPGGDVLGQKGGEPVSNQTDEVKRVEKIVFGDLDAQAPSQEKRFRQMILLLNLYEGLDREGVYALLKDLPEPLLKEKDDRESAYRGLRLAQTRTEMTSLGRTAAQIGVLEALAALGNVASAIDAELGPAEVGFRTREARRALALWALGEVDNAVPNPLPVAGENPPKNENLERLQGAITALLPEILKDNPDQAQVDAGVNRLKALSEGASNVVPAIADVLGNLLVSRDPDKPRAKIEEAKAKLVELLLARSVTEAEKKAMTALGDLFILPPSTLPPQAPLDAVREERDKTFAKNIDTAANELIRAYFEAATVKPTTEENLPPDPKDVRTQLASKKNVNDPEEKRRNIAHLLYHLDANVGADPRLLAEWFKTFQPPGRSGEGSGQFKLPAQEESLLSNREAWHKRVAAIVGLEAYVATAEAQATRFADYSMRMRTRIAEEQGRFESEYQTIVQDTLKIASELADREAEVKKQEGLKKAREEQLKARLEERKALENELARVTNNAKTALTNLDNKVDELFQITKQLGEAQDALVGLEMKLHDMELGKAQKKKSER